MQYNKNDQKQIYKLAIIKTDKLDKMCEEAEAVMVSCNVHKYSRIKMMVHPVHEIESMKCHVK